MLWVIIAFSVNPYWRGNITTEMFFFFCKCWNTLLSSDEWSGFIAHTKCFTGARVVICIPHRWHISCIFLWNSQYSTDGQKSPTPFFVPRPSFRVTVVLKRWWILSCTFVCHVVSEQRVMSSPCASEVSFTIPDPASDWWGAAWSAFSLYRLAPPLRSQEP